MNAARRRGSRRGTRKTYQMNSRNTEAANADY